MNAEITPNDLDWLAFCYVADEMSLEERAEFELRFLEDPAACEAVVAAMQLTESLNVAIADEFGLTDGASNLSQPSGHSESPKPWPKKSSSPNRMMTPHFVFAASIVLALFSAASIWLANSGSMPMAEVSELAETWVAVAEVVTPNQSEALDTQFTATGSSYDMAEAEVTDQMDWGIDDQADIEEFSDSDVDNQSDTDDSDWMMVALEDLQDLGGLNE